MIAAPAAPASNPPALVNAMSVDVEDWFQVSAMERSVARRDWDTMALRVERNTDRCLQMFADAQIKATFFLLGWVAERCPQLIRRIAEQGHEVASHGWEHVRANTQTPEQFRVDISRTKQTLEDLSGQPVKGYRAASYSILRENLWALEELMRAGYQYSSSIYPVRHDLYGIPEAPRTPFRPRHAPDLLEIPVTTAQVAGRNLPAGGGGWFRLLPYAASRWLIRRVNDHEQRAAVFYFHPWEIDPAQPRPATMPVKTRFRHYINLSRMQPRLEILLRDFRWGRMDDIFLTQPAPIADVC